MRIRTALTTVAAAAAVVVGVPLTMLATAPPAFACSCVSSDLVDQLARHEVVFAGTVTAVGEPRDGGYPGGTDVEWEFQVDAVHRGTVGAQQSVSSPQSSASCGYEFVVGRTYLVVGSEHEGALRTGLCEGTAELSDLSAADLELLGPGVVPAGAERPAVESAEPAVESAEPAAAIDRDPPSRDRITVVVPVVAGIGLVLVGAWLVVALRRRRT